MSRPEWTSNARLLIVPAILGFVALGAPDVNARSFQTTFPTEENPISEGGVWINGKKTGLDWNDVRTVPGFVVGTQAGNPSPPYDDSVALLTGTWGPAQFAQATVKASDCTDDGNQEVELFLRGSITAHSITGYEFNFRCSQSHEAYAGIVRWNGKLDDFTGLAYSGGPSSGVKNGDVVTAVAVGDVFQAYINGSLIAHAIDKTFRNGSPGIGFYFYKHAIGKTDTFGFSNFNATDSVPPQFPAQSLAIGQLYFSQALERHRKLAWFGGSALIGFIACMYFAFRGRRSR